MRTPALPSPRRRGLAGLTAASLVVAPLAFGFATPADAVSPNVVISEVYGAGGNAGAVYNADFVELSNPTASAVSLAGKYIHYRAGTGGSGGTPFALTGSIPAGGKYLIQMSATGANGVALPAPDASPASLAMAAAGGQVYLLDNATAITTTGNQAGVAGIIDMVGVSGATSFETAAATVGGSTTNSVNRTAADADKNNLEFGLAAPSPENSGPATPTALEATDPADQTGQVGKPVTGFTLQATGGTAPYSWTATGTPPGVSVATNGAVSGTPTTEGVYTVTATATDSATTPAVDSVEFTYTISAAAVLRPIADIQGTGTTSPLLGQNVKTRGIVTAAYPAGGFFGFYIQTPGTGAANIDLATHTASDAVFVRQTAGSITAAPGNYVEVTGTVAEFAGATQVEVVAAGIQVLSETAEPVVTTTTATWPAAGAQKESLEGMRYRPTGDFTVSNTFSTNNFGEVGLANGTKPLIQRTEVERPGPAGSSATEADNLARAVILDDGASTNFLLTGNSTQCSPRPSGCLLNGNLTPPYVSTADPVRVGAKATFNSAVIFTQGGSPTAPTYRFQPLATVVGPDNTGTPATFEDTRTASPDEALINETGTADLKVASFNVLNYFTTLGDPNDDNIGDGGCTPFRDRDGDGNTVNSGCDQRGAWDPQDFQRQQSKIVSAINALDADVVGLMEIENSLTLGETPDEATNSLVVALNAAAGAGTWAANPSSSELPANGMDVITSAIIYKSASVDRVGQARALGTLSDAGEAFDNAREPLGQIFQADAGGEPFLFVVNHFKSKGSAGPNPGDADSGDGQGASNGSRVLQATALRDWVQSLQTETGVESVVLGGDFNSYAQEDPLWVLYNAGFTNVEQEFGNGEYSYSFSGLSGSLDHILVNDAALARATGTDIWNINGGESLALEYSRFNYHGTDFHAAGPYRSSDHDPVVLGLMADAVPPAPVDIQILGTNDFHGRLLNNTGGPFPNDAGAAVLSGAVKQLRGQNPNTVFAAAGDLIGASTFESFIQKDVPTIDALNEAGLEVSAVGNHEFDAGYSDLLDRVIPLADWKYIGANVDKPGAPAEDLLEPTFVKEMGGVQVGFIGAVTEHLDELVSPASIEGVVIEDIVAATNREADALEAAGVDVIVLLVHEGAPGTSCATMDDDATSDFGSIITGVNDKVDAIVSGHTHLAYNCSFPVAGWADRPVKERPVVSAGQYGTRLNQLLFQVDPATGEVQAKSQNLLDLESGTGVALYPVDVPTKAIVDAAVAEANTLGAVELGKIAGPFYRAKLANGTTENRGNESTLGNLVAEVQRWATPETVGGAQIAFMNPGGMRDDMIGVAGDFPRTLTYRQAANVQSFANTLVNMDLTGAQIKSVLEQQWQPAGASRPFLRLGVSEGFGYTYDATKAAGSRITGMWLDGEPIVAGTSYSVTANSFLAGGGDNFSAFATGTGKQDTGRVDLAAMVDYMEEFANASEGDAPLGVDYSQRAVGVTFGAGAPASYAAGDDVAFAMSSLSMSGPGDVKDTEVEVALGDEVLGTAPVTTTLQSSLPGFDEVGTAGVSVAVPACVTGDTLVITGNNTGTEVLVPIVVTAPDCIVTKVFGTNITIEEGQAGSVPVRVSPSTATGDIILGLGQMTLETTLVNGAGSIPIAAGALPVGVHELGLDYTGDALHRSSTGTVVVTVTAKPAPGAVGTTVTGTAAPITYGTFGSVSVKVAPASATGTVAVSKGAAVLGSTTVASGQGTVALAAKSLPVGTHTLTLTYSGDAGHKPSTGSVTVVVIKAEATVRARVKPKRVVADKTRARVIVTVDAEGFVPTGRVKVLVAGKTYRAKLVDGKAVIKLQEFEKPRKYTAKISYLGDDSTEAARTKLIIRVKRR